MPVTANKKKYEIAVRTLKNSDKKRNGDSCLAEIIKKNNSEFIFLAIADGVSSCPKDYFASETICKNIFAFLTEAEERNSATIDSAVFRANRILSPDKNSSIKILVKMIAKKISGNIIQEFSSVIRKL